MSGSITVGGKILASHDNVSGKLSMSENVVFPADHVIQVKSVIRNTEWQGPDTVNNEHTLFTTDTSQTTAHTNTTFKVEITPISNTSKFLVQYAINIGNASTGVSFKLYRGNGTSPTYGSSGSRTPQSSASAWTHDGNQAQQTCYTILDEPATDAQLTYYLTYVYFGTKPWFNTNTSRAGQEYDDVYTSTLTVMEISG